MVPKLTIKSIIRWEQLTGRPFSLMDHADRSDLETLLYTTTVCNGTDKTYTFDEFRLTLANKKLVNRLGAALEKEVEVLAQFQEENKRGIKSNKAGGDPRAIKEIVSDLVMDGLDAHFAYTEMELQDLPPFIEAYERKKKERLENDRLWTMLAVQPHLTKRIQPGDLCVFPWEIEESKAHAEKEMETNKENLEKFLSGELFDIDSVNWKKKND